MTYKVVHITTVHKSDDIRIYHKECMSLKNEGYDVWLIAPSSDNSDSEINTIYLPKVRGRIKRMLLLPMKAFLAAYKLKADIYHFHDPELIPLGMLLRMFGKKVIYDAHENISAQILSKKWINVKLRRIISACVGKIEQLGCRYFSAVVTATPSIREYFRDKTKRVIDINNFPILRETVEQSEDRNTIVYIGGISSIRGASEMIDVASRLDAELVMCGPISKCVDSQIIQNAKNIDYRGVRPRKEVATLLSKTLIGLVLFHPVPNHTDAMPNKIFEYLQQGVAVIGSNFPLWKEILEDNNCGICVDPLNVDEIVNAIEYLRQNREVALQMGENGRRLVQTKFNWSGEAKKLVSLYNGLLQVKSS